MSKDHQEKDKGKKEEDRKKYDKRKKNKKIKKKWKGLSLRILPRRNSFDDEPLY